MTNVEADDASWTYIAFETDTWGYVYTNTMYGPCLPLDVSLRVRVVHASNGESVRDVELEVGSPLDT